MTMPKTLTKAAEKQITADWQSAIPSLGIYKPRWLLRRVGPLLVGICLDRDSSGEIYKPCFHVHFLGKESPCVYLTLITQLRSERSGGPSFVQVRWHQEKYKEAAARMVRQSLLPLEGDVRLKAVIAAYRGFMRTPMGRFQREPIFYRDMVFLSAWAGDGHGAAQLFGECLGSAYEEISYRHVGGREAFETECRTAIEKSELIQEMVERQIVALHVGHLPVSQLIR